MERRPLDRDTQKVIRYWFYAVMVVAILRLLGACARIETAPKPAEPMLAIAPIVENNLDFLYFAIAERAGLEGAFCMLGKAENGAIVITGLVPSWVDSADVGNIMYRPSLCPKYTIGTVHFHPGIGYCAFSSIDLNTAHNLPYPTMAIVCRDSTSERPKFMLSRREEFDRAWEKLEWCHTCAPHRFTAVYRYSRIPP